MADCHRTTRTESQTETLPKIQQRSLRGAVLTISSSIRDRAPLPKRVVLTGFMGAGKSTLGLLLARGLAWTFVDLDEEIVGAEQKNIADIFAAVGEAGFREMERLALAKTLQREGIVLALGGGAIETEANRQLLQQDRETLLVYLEAPLDVLIARCERQQLETKTARRPVLEKRAELAARFLSRMPLYEEAHWTLHTTGHDPEEITAAVLQRWKQTPWI